MGVTLPLLVIATVLAVGASRRSTDSVGNEEEAGGHNRSDGVRTAKTIAGISLTLIATPFVLAALLLCVYGLFFLGYLLSH